MEIPMLEPGHPRTPRRTARRLCPLLLAGGLFLAACSGSGSTHPSLSTSTTRTTASSASTSSEPTTAASSASTATSSPTASSEAAAASTSSSEVPTTTTTTPPTTTTTEPPTTTTEPPTTTTTEAPTTTSAPASTSSTAASTSSSSPTTTTTTPTPTSSSTPWGWIIAGIVLVAAAIVLIVVLVGSRSRRRAEQAWAESARPAADQAIVARNLLDEPGARDDATRRQAPGDDARAGAASAAGALREAMFALESERLLRAGPNPPTGDQLAQADQARRTAFAHLDSSLAGLQARIGP